MERIEAMEDELADHTHTYLTGSGEGHNNTEAETGLAEDGEWICSRQARVCSQSCAG